MPTYQTPGNLQYYAAPLYQPNWGLIDRVAELQQHKYESGVQSIRSTYNDALGLEQGKSPYNQSRINTMMDEATSKLKKMTTLDFSNASNVAQAQNLYAPIFNDQDIMTEESGQRYFQKESQSAIAMRDSKDKDQRDGYSAINYRYISRPAEELSQATTREGMLTAANKLMNRRYLPYQNTMQNWDDNATKDKLDENTIDAIGGPGGAYIISKNLGGTPYATLRNYAQGHFTDNDAEQQRINATVAIEDLQDELKARGIEPTNEHIAHELFTQSKDYNTQQLQTSTLTRNSIQQEVDKLLEKQKTNGLSTDDSENLWLKQQQLSQMNSNLADLQKEADGYKDEQGSKLYQDYKKDPISYATQLAYNQLIDNWANTYGAAHYKEKWAKNDVWEALMKNQTDLLRIQAENDRADKAKTKETKTDEKANLANYPSYGGQNPHLGEGTTVVTDYYKGFLDVKRGLAKEVNDGTQQLTKYYLANVLGVQNTDFLDKLQQDVLNKPDSPLSKEAQDALSATTLYGGVALSGRSNKDVYNQLYWDGMKEVQKQLDSKSGQLLPQLAEAKRKIQLAQTGLDNIRDMENTNPNLKAIRDFNQYLGPDGTPLSNKDYQLKRLAQDGYEVKNEPSLGVLPIGGVFPGVNVNVDNDIVFYKDGKKVNLPLDQLKKYNEEYAQIKGKMSDARALLNKDPDIQKIVASKNYGYARWDAVKGENGVVKKTARQVYTDEMLGSPVNISNFDAIDVNGKGMQYLNELKALDEDEFSFMETSGVADKSGKNPYRFYFNSDVLAKFRAQHSKDDDKGKDAEAFTQKLSANGVVINYAGPTPASINHDNTLEMYFRNNNSYSFKVDKDNNFGMEIKKIQLPTGGVSYQAFINYMTVATDNGKPDGKPLMGADGHYIMIPKRTEGQTIQAQNLDEAGEAASDMLQQFMQYYQEKSQYVKTY